MSHQIIYIICTLSLLYLNASNAIASNKWPNNCVEINSFTHDGDTYQVIYLKSQACDKQIKVKYFGGRDLQSNTVYQRYRSWSEGKNIIAVSSGGYVDVLSRPVGFTMDSGVPVNKKLRNYDALVMVHANGEMNVTDLSVGNLKVTATQNPTGKTLDIRNNILDKQFFTNWCQDEKVSVFQTHLLASDNQIRVGAKSSSEPRERRFLAVGYVNDKLVHIIVNNPSFTSLYECTQRTLKFLQEMMQMNVTYLLNLDTGHQDVFELYDEDGNQHALIKGHKPVNKAYNLLVFYIE